MERRQNCPLTDNGKMFAATLEVIVPVRGRGDRRDSAPASYTPAMTTATPAARKYAARGASPMHCLPWHPGARWLYGYR